MKTADPPLPTSLQHMVDEDRILIPCAREVVDYLDAHRDLALIVPSACSQARQEFGPEAELELKVYRDPEIDDHYLSLYARLPSYDETIMTRIERVTHPFDDELCSASGYFLVTTDFGRPRANHAV